MTQEPPPSWPRRDTGPEADPTMAVDPLTGEPMSGWSVARGPDLTKPGRASGRAEAYRAGPVDGGTEAAPSWSGHDAEGFPQPGEGPAGHPAPGDGTAGHPPPGYGPATYPPSGYGPATYPPSYYGPPGYPPPGYRPAPYPPVGHPLARPTNGLAIASLVLGAVWMFWIGSVLALVLGYAARGQIRRTGEDGDGVAVAGIVLGWVGVGLLVLLVVAGVLGDS
ncbi:MAG: DUF4190 domain-containing protein [Pseudonocardia sp.]|uniref:DUF4190 domain-containing protein n=1 Tax=Pseudonocardia sp. TaxID=60912 RepID=UPI001ACE836D|nr:DUF4190 domain-containing protein [Pseudonocardia sp.]MBN9097418.1 DUF4190 domain-containing protein [Pseudonocardia sp.]